MNLFEKQNKPFAIKLSERVKEEIEKTFGYDLSSTTSNYFQYFNNEKTALAFVPPKDYPLITEAEFFGDGNELTPMQELISKLHPNFFTEEEANYYLEREKQVIEDAYTSNCRLYSCEENKTNCECGQNYYNQKFRKDE